jgi:hypothetical protein
MRTLKQLYFHLFSKIEFAKDEKTKMVTIHLQQKIEFLILFFKIEHLFLKEVLQNQINIYRQVFEDACRNVEKLDRAVSKYFGEPAQIVNNAGT